MNTLVLDWLDENSIRAYPIRDNSLRTDGDYTLPDDVIVDAQFIFNVRPPSFRLVAVSSTSIDVTFEFSTGEEITVSKTNSFPYYHRESNGWLLVLGPGLASIPEGDYTFDIVFEPSTIFEYGGPWKGVTSWAFDSSTALTGKLKFLEGYQFDIATAGQQINFNVGRIFGEQISCETFTSLPANCDSIISYISNAYPTNQHQISIKPGPGIVVLDDPENHRIYIGFSFTSINDICPDIPPFPFGNV